MGKFWAILGRNYIKWRDIFDIRWYLNNLFLIDKLNFSYLNSIIWQINVHRPIKDKLNTFSLDKSWVMLFTNIFKQKIYYIIKNYHSEIIKDVSPFILDNTTKQHFLNNLKTWSFLTLSNNLISLPIF